MCLCFVFLGGNQDGKFSVGFRDGVVRTVVGLDRETQAAYTLGIEAIGVSFFYNARKASSSLIILAFTHSVCICYTVIGLVFLLVLFVIFKAVPFYFCTTMRGEKSNVCTSAVISDYCSTAFVPVRKERTKTLRFSCFGSQGGLSAEGARQRGEKRQR